LGWHPACSVQGMIERYLLSCLGALFAASIGAFLLYVPIMPLAAIVVVLLGMVLMFFLGLHLGGQEMLRTEEPDRKRALPALLGRAAKILGAR
jgi:hypothetical protein